MFTLGSAIVAVVWVGRQVRGTLGAGATKKPSAEGFDAIPPALVKQALERGLITSAQLATMSPVERRFVLLSVQKQMEGAAGPTASAASTVSSVSSVSSVVQGVAVAPTPPPRPGMPTPPVTDANTGIPERPRLKLWCPLCGEPLKLPAFPPMVAVCGACGAKTAARDDSGPGRYVLNVTAPQGAEPPRIQ